MKCKLTDALPLLLMLLCAAVLGILLLTGTVTADALFSLAKGRSRPVAIAVFLTLYALKGLTGVIVYDALLLAVAALFPLTDAIVINSVGLLICLSVSYLIGYHTKNQTAEQRLERYPKLKKYFGNAKDGGFWFCFFLHALNLSLEAQGVLLGLMRVPYGKYLLGSFLAVAPGMLCFTIFGNEWNFENPAFWVILFINICMIVSAVIYTKRRILEK